MMSQTKRISLWSGPRNISTALMYSFAQRKDTAVLDEPLYAFYLNQTNAKVYHPGAETVLKTMEKDGEKVIDQLLKLNAKPVYFFKNMTHHLLDLDRSFLSSMFNVILSRDPVDMLPSFHRVIPNPTLEDVGYKAHMELIEELESRNLPYHILDSKKVLQNPEGELSALCQKIGIQFDEAMLSWEEGAREEDGPWAQYWYKNVHNSTTFAPYQAKEEAFPKELEPLLEKCKFYYEQIIARSA